VHDMAAWSGEVAAMFRMKLPVTPMRRFEHYLTAGSPIERLPYVKDVARLAFRSEGKGFSRCRVRASLLPEEIPVRKPNGTHRCGDDSSPTEGG
jgi:hypothetical protein